jgi:hypothetical protein
MKVITIVLGMILTATVMAKNFTNQDTAFACTTDKYGTTICW